jgi:hypothetical protein
VLKRAAYAVAILVLLLVTISALTPAPKEESAQPKCVGYRDKRQRR